MHEIRRQTEANLSVDSWDREHVENKHTTDRRFSLRTLMVGVFFCCLLAYFGRYGVHVILFLVATIAFGACTAFSVVRYRRGHKLGPGSVAATAIACCLFYVASVGPAAMFFEGPGIANAICEVVYGPLLIADNLLPSRPIDDYADKWKRMMGK